MTEIRLTLAIATVDRALLCRCLAQALRTATETLDVCLYGNGIAIDEQMLLMNSIYASLSEPDKRARELHTDERVVPASIQLAHDPSNHGVPAALHTLYAMAAKGPTSSPPSQHVVLYLHDDVFLLERGWDVQVKRAFEDDRVALGGFLGAIGVGSDAIYQTPYEPNHLARYGGLSNLTNAQAHGERVATPRPVAFVDGMAMAVRRSVLDALQGWSWWPMDIVHHGYDVALACQVRRLGGRVMLIPVDCQHGVETTHGLTSGTAAVSPALYEQAQAAHGAAHKFVYETFRDVLPLRLREDEFWDFARALPWEDEAKLVRSFTFLTGADRARAAAVARTHGLAAEARLQRMLGV